MLVTWSVSSLAEIKHVRHELLGWIARPGVTDPAGALGSVADNMLLVASELASNALRHGRPPTVVQLLRHGDRLILDVADHDPFTAPVIAGERPAGEGGFGLVIARRLAQQVGWYTNPPTKHVWAMFSAQA